MIEGRIGSNFDQTEKFSDQIDEVRTYDRRPSASPTEITELASDQA